MGVEPSSVRGSSLHTAFFLLLSSFGRLWLCRHKDTLTTLLAYSSMFVMCHPLNLLCATRSRTTPCPPRALPQDLTQDITEGQLYNQQVHWVVPVAAPSCQCRCFFLCRSMTTASA